MNRWFSLVIAHLLITMNEVHSEQLFTKLELQVMKKQENRSMNTKAASLSLSDLPSLSESNLCCLFSNRLPTLEQRNQQKSMQACRISTHPAFQPSPSSISSASFRLFQTFHFTSKTLFWLGSFRCVMIGPFFFSLMAPHYD